MKKNVRAGSTVSTASIAATAMVPPVIVSQGNAIVPLDGQGWHVKRNVRKEHTDQIVTRNVPARTACHVTK